MQDLCCFAFVFTQKTDGKSLNIYIFYYYYFVRICAPPHAAVRGGVPAVCLSLDEQPPDERVAITMHNQTVGHLPGTTKLLLFCFLFVFTLFVCVWFASFQKLDNLLLFWYQLHLSQSTMMHHYIDVLLLTLQIFSMVFLIIQGWLYSFTLLLGPTAQSC